ncbi:MAG: ABC transporter permease, partial [Pygmaiobacter sp.]
TFISVAVGILLGSVFLFFLLQFLHLNYTCNLSLLFFGVVLMVTIAVLFGFFPAFRAARMKPLDALREE